MDLTTMRTAVRTRAGVPSSDGFYTDAQLTDLVNEALQAVTTEAQWPWLTTSMTFATVAGQTTAYGPPADWVRTRALTIDGYAPMIHKSLQEIREYPTTSRGLPTAFTINDDGILLAPVADAIYTVRHDYVQSEPALSADGNTPIMPSQFHYAIVAFATHLAAGRAGDSKRAQIALGDYIKWLERMNAFKSRTSAPKMIRVRPGRDI